MVKKREIEEAFMNQLIKHILAKCPNMTREDVIKFFTTGDEDRSN